MGNGSQDFMPFVVGLIILLALLVVGVPIGFSMALVGVLGEIHANPFLIDAIVGLSVAYKAFENLGGFRALGVRIDTRAAVLVFGLFHGFGLATKLQPVALSSSGLVGNIVSFNVGVELGQLAALGAMLIVFNAWRATGSFMRHAYAANVLLKVAGFMLIGYQLTGYWTS